MRRESLFKQTELKEKIMSDKNGNFVWYDLMTTDAKAAESFYKSVLGWEAKDAGVAKPYTIFSVGAAGVAGMMQINQHECPAGTQPGWSGYVLVDDVDACASTIEAAGGSVRRPGEDIPGVGRFAVVADADGAVFQLFKDAGGTPMTPPAPGAHGTIGWHELHAGDGPSAFAFYSGIFGWTKGEAMDMGELGVYQLFASGGEPVGGMMTKTPETPAPFWLYYFNVDGLDAAIERATAGGGKVLMGPQQVPGGSWIVQCLDPQGAMFAMVAMTR